MANWLLWPRSSGCNMAETYESLLYWYQGEQSEFDANKTQTKKKQHVTHHSSQNLLDPRNPRGPIQTCNIWTVDVTTPWRPPQWVSWVCRTYSVCVVVPGWESLKIRWLNYHLCRCPHWSLIYAHCGRKSMSPLSNTPTCIWICTDFFPTHPVFFFNK